MENNLLTAKDIRRAVGLLRCSRKKRRRPKKNGLKIIAKFKLSELGDDFKVYSFF